MKKLNKLVAILVAMAMVLSLSIVAAFAAPAADNEKAGQFKITKTLKMPEGTKTPASEFYFNIALQSADSTAGGKTFAANSVKAEFTANQATENGTGYIYATDDIENLFAGFTTPGKYVYRITEVTVAPSTQSDDDETYTYDNNAEYELRLYVDKDGNHTYTLLKKDPTTNTFEKTTTEAPGEEGGARTAVADFENTYVKTTKVVPDGVDPEDPQGPGTTADDGAFYFEKVIANDTSHMFDNNDFIFTVNVAKPAINSLSTTKTGYSYKKIKVGATAAEIAAVEPQTIAPDTDVTITLKNGERIVFTDIDVGAEVSVTETPYADFNQEAKLNTAATATDATAATTAKVAQDVDKSLVVTNTSLKETGPEGILISNLPYIALALVAIGGLVAYVVVRRRQDDEA